MLAVGHRRPGPGDFIADPCKVRTSPLAHPISLHSNFGPSAHCVLLQGLLFLPINRPSQLRKLPQSPPPLALHIPHCPHLPHRNFQSSFWCPRCSTRLPPIPAPSPASSPARFPVSRGWRERRGVRGIRGLEGRGIDDLQLRAELRVFSEEGGEGRVVEEKIVAGG